MPRGALEDAARLSGKVAFSVRPQSMRLDRQPPADAGNRPSVEVTIVERAYLGEFWDYVVAPAQGALRLKVTASPLTIFQVGEKAWLEFDPLQMAPIA